MTYTGFPESGTDLANSSDAQLLPTRIPAPGSRLGRRFGGQQRWPCRRTEQKREGQTPSPSDTGAGGGDGPSRRCGRRSERRRRHSGVHLLLLLSRRVPLHGRLLQPRPGPARRSPAADHSQRCRRTGVALPRALRRRSGDPPAAAGPVMGLADDRSGARRCRAVRAPADSHAPRRDPIVDRGPLAILPARSPDRLITRILGAQTRHNPGRGRTRSEV
jgi:hypothetical protein